MTLKEWLDTPGNTSLALARQVGVKAHTTVLRWAKGRVPLEHVSAVSRATGIAPAVLNPALADVLTEHASKPDFTTPPQLAPEVVGA